MNSARPYRNQLISIASTRTAVRMVVKWIFAGLLSTALVISASSSRAQSSDLPELGDSASKYLSPTQETQIGQTFLRQLIAHRFYVEDYELRDYMQTLGNSIGQFAELRGTQLTFNLLEDNNLNAFAVPGGYITFNTGLLMATDAESELASVLGHEIAHLTQRHLPRLIARANENKIPLIAAIIASILIGGQAGLAGVTATNAAVASNQLSYSRDFEREADAIGIQLLVDAKYDPNAMAVFFGKLEKFTRHDSTKIPEFLRTHPLSYTRIAESEARAAAIASQPSQSSFEYYLAKSRIRAHFVKRQDDPILFFKDQIKSGRSEVRDAAMYGMAISLTHSRRYEQAATFLAQLLEKYPNHPWIEAAQADLELRSNRSGRGIDRYKSAIDNNPNKLFLSYYLANAYLKTGQPELAKKIVRYQIRRHPQTYPLYSLLSKANADMNNLAEAHQADAEYHGILGDYEKAIASLKLALRDSNSEGYLTQSIEAKLADMENKLALQRKTKNG